MLKQHIQNNFNKVAPTYLRHTNIQKVTGLSIANLINKHQINFEANCQILDLGSGPGSLLHSNYANTSVILYDLSHSMLKQGMTNGQNLGIVGDATLLPFANNSFDYIISNLMLQWITNKNIVFKEIHRILKPQGRLILTSLIKPSLWQLQEVWQIIDGNNHTLDFNTDTELKNLITENHLSVNDFIYTEYTMHFKSYLDLIKHFKNSGTSITQQQSKGLYKKSILNKVNNLYKQKFGINGTIPLSYHYMATILCKEII